MVLIAGMAIGNDLLPKWLGVPALVAIVLWNGARRTKLVRSLADAQATETITRVDGEVASIRSIDIDSNPRRQWFVAPLTKIAGGCLLYCVEASVAGFIAMFATSEFDVPGWLTGLLFAAFLFGNGIRFAKNRRQE